MEDNTSIKVVVKVVVSAVITVVVTFIALSIIYPRAGGDRYISGYVDGQTEAVAVQDVELWNTAYSKGYADAIEDMKQGR